MSDRIYDHVMNMENLSEYAIYFCFWRKIEMIFLKQIPGCMEPQRNKNTRLNHVNFFRQKLGTAMNFILRGAPRFWQHALDQIGQVKIIPGKPCGFHQLVKYPA